MKLGAHAKLVSKNNTLLPCFFPDLLSHIFQGADPLKRFSIPTGKNSVIMEERLVS